jgi:hypothetical protein
MGRRIFLFFLNIFFILQRILFLILIDKRAKHITIIGNIITLSTVIKIDGNMPSVRVKYKYKSDAKIITEAIKPQAAPKHPIGSSPSLSKLGDGIGG